MKINIGDKFVALWIEHAMGIDKALLVCTSLQNDKVWFNWADRIGRNEFNDFTLGKLTDKAIPLEIYNSSLYKALKED